VEFSGAGDQALERQERDACRGVVGWCYYDPVTLARERNLYRVARPMGGTDARQAVTARCLGADVKTRMTKRQSFNDPEDLFPNQCRV